MLFYNSKRQYPSSSTFHTFMIILSSLVPIIVASFTTASSTTSSFIPHYHTTNHHHHHRNPRHDHTIPIHNNNYYNPPPTTQLKNHNHNNNELPQLNHDEIARYSRHLVLSQVGMRGQSQLKNSAVLVIGAGGLGSPCLMYLAAAGVGHIGIVDADTVDESNLQRQIIHGTSTLNISKCQSAFQRIKDINPHVKVALYEEEFTSTSAMRILNNGFVMMEDHNNDNTDDETDHADTTTTTKKSWDVVIDGSDNFPTKYLINDACDIAGLPWVYSAILAFEGQLSVFNYKNGPTYRDMMPVPPPPGEVPSCAEGGVLGVLPGTMGCLQATEALKIILGKDEGLLSGRILVFDAMKMKFGEVGLKKLESREKIRELIDYQGFCAGPKIVQTTSDSSQISNTMNDDSTKRTMDEADTANSSSDYMSSSTFNSLSPKETFEKLSKGWSPWVVDVRLKTENDIVQLPFTDTVAPHRTIRLDHIPTSGDILVYCKMGARGKKACTRLVDLGVDPMRLYNLDGGIMGWRRDVDPNMPKY